MTKRTHVIDAAETIAHETAARESAEAEKADETHATPAAPLPSLGRIVIYSHPGGPLPEQNPRECAALVTGVNPDGSVSLFVAHADGSIMSVHNVKHGTEFGTWHWPVRV